MKYSGIRHDPENKRISIMWTADGISHRLNIVQWGGEIVYHEHKKPHTTYIKGRFDCYLTSPDGVETVKKLKTGDSLLIEAYWRHRFVPTPIPLDEPQVWEADCQWPEGVDIDGDT